MTSFSSQPERKSRAKSAWIKRSTIALPLLCLMIFGTVIGARLISGATSAGAASLTPIKGHVPALVKKSTLVGATDPNQSLSLSVGLQLRNAAALKTYADNAIRSRSTKKPQHLTPAQVAEAFAPLASSQQAVIDYLQGYGFHVTTTVSQHLVIGVRGTVGDAENAFHLQINNYRSPAGQNFYAPANEPSVPANLAGLIQSVVGLDNLMHFTHTPIMPKKLSANATTNTAVMSYTNSALSCTSSQLNGYTYYTLSQIATAYNLTGLYNAGFKGEGQTVALVELDGFNSSDISTYTQCYGGSSVPIHTIGSVTRGDGAVEVELDMELILSAAPHLAGLDVYEAPNDSSHYIAEIGQIVSDAVPVVSTSWGSCESSGFAQAVYQQENTDFTLAAAQGQTIFAASGDNGTNDCLGGDLSANSLAVDDPASQPYVTGVGGTTLTLGSNNSYGSEATWHYGGGGISSQWTQPSWQQGPGVSNPNYPNNGYREVPDVSLNADPNTGYLYYCTSGYYCDGVHYPKGWWIIGGTSTAAPMWAAFMALTNQKTLHDGGFDIGFLNPYLYQIDQNAGGTSYANDFHDITSGGNDTLGNGTGPYQASANYDMATGLGSYNALNLANDLEKLANAQNGTRQAPANTTWYFAEGSVAGTGNFQEYIILFNPSPTQTATVNIQYLFTGTSQVVTKTHTVPPSNRLSVSANADLGITGGGQQSISAIVTSVAANSTPAVPIVAERTLYFNYQGTRTGTDVLGATNVTNKVFYFSQGDSRWTSTAQMGEFITILNPSATQTAHITATYYANGKVAGTSTVTLAPLQRGTTRPPFQGQAAVMVTSDIGLAVERVQYTHAYIPTAGGWINGASTAVGATTLGNDWLHAEGHEGSKFQEYLVLANFTNTATTATIKLEYSNGFVQSSSVQVNPYSQYYFDAKAAALSCGNPCGISPDFASDVSASSSSIVVERFVYLQGAKTPVGTINGTTDAVGEPGPASHSVYTFAEGFTGTSGFTTGDFTDYLLMQNPTSNKETVVVTLFADNMVIQQEITMLPDSRATIVPNSIVVPIAKAYPNGTAGYGVSMEVQALNGGTIVVERAEYFDLGGTDILGYTGG